MLTTQHMAESIQLSIPPTPSKILGIHMLRISLGYPKSPEFVFGRFLESMLEEQKFIDEKW